MQAELGIGRIQARMCAVKKIQQRQIQSSRLLIRQVHHTRNMYQLKKERQFTGKVLV